MNRTGNFLEEIVLHKRMEVQSGKQSSDRDAMIQAAHAGAPVRSFLNALTECPPPCIIAEIKRKSPSKGELIQAPDVKKIAQGFATEGAAALSVLTDERYFGGTLDDLRNIRSSVDIPVLRKDFIVDEFQIYESRAAGADTVLLIVKVLGNQLVRFIELSRELGMEPLVEIHNEDELNTAIDAGSRIVGINSRNLESFVTTTAVVLRLIEHVPKHLLTIAESGITSSEIISELMQSGVHGFLIGEAFMRAPSPEKKLKEFIDKIRLSPNIERR